MVKVRPVRMAVTDGLVLVPVRMSERGGLTGMGVIVMSIIVAVHMNMLHFLVLVIMRVLVIHQKVYSQTHHAAGKKLHQGQRFAEENRREQDAEEGRRSKYHLRARRTQLLRRCDV